MTRWARCGIERRKRSRTDQEAGQESRPGPRPFTNEELLKVQDAGLQGVVEELIRWWVRTLYSKSLALSSLG